MYCRNCGTEIYNQDAVCPKCGASQNSQPEVVDNGGFGWGVLGFFVPLAGLILYLVWNDKKPKSAKAAGIGALVAVSVGVLFSIIYFIFFMSVVLHLFRSYSSIACFLF